MSEFLELKDCLEQAKLGSFLVIPLKFEEGQVRQDWLARLGDPQPLTTMDFTEPVKDLLEPGAPAGAGVRYRIIRDLLAGELLGAAAGELRVRAGEGEPERPFCLADSWLYLFHTQVAFLCLGVAYEEMETLCAICNPGFAENSAEYAFTDPAGQTVRFSLEEKLQALCARAGLAPLYDRSPLLLEANSCNLALTSRRFRDLETMERISFNQHRMVPLTEEIEDRSEADVRFVSSVRNQDLDTYRWGCCISSQSLSYVVADETMDFAGEFETQAQDSLPLLVLALFERYTCLRFTQLIAAPDGKKPKRLRRLKRMMLEFQAFCTVSPANLSRWHNVKEIYRHILETNGVPEALDDIQYKLGILVERQQELDAARSSTVNWLLTLFGITSILASVLSIIQILAGGSSLEWYTTILSSLIMFGLMAAVVLISRRDQ